MLNHSVYHMIWNLIAVKKLRLTIYWYGWFYDKGAVSAQSSSLPPFLHGTLFSKINMESLKSWKTIMIKLCPTSWNLGQCKTGVHIHGSEFYDFELHCLLRSPCHQIKKCLNFAGKLNTDMIWVNKKRKPVPGWFKYTKFYFQN